MDSARRPVQHGEELPFPNLSNDGVDTVDHHDMDGAENAIVGVPGQYSDPDYTLEGKKFEPKLLTQ